MGKYTYSDGEKSLNKVLKYNQLASEKISKDMDGSRKAADRAIAESEVLLSSLNKSLPDKAKVMSGIDCRARNVPLIMPRWSELAEEVSEAIPYDVDLEDILSQQEFEHAYNDLEDINAEFSRETGLNTMDLLFLVTATALQTARWVLMPSIGEKIDKASRVTDKDGDRLVKNLKKKYVDKHADWSAEKKAKGRRLREREGKTWKEIVFDGVPYDVTAGSKALNINLEGQYHRYKTLGHDPILGWVFGTTNILTDTMTLNNLVSYRVKNGKMLPDTVFLPMLFSEAIGIVQSDEHMLPAALFRQGLHFQSDKLTKNGLPIPFLGIFNENLAGKLYKSQYDLLCFERDSKIVGLSAAFAIIINIIIGLIHGLLYKESDGSRDLYEVRTRKILMISNTLSTTSNLILTGATGNIGKLDIGGTMVTICRLFSDVRFIARIKQQYIEEHLNEQWKDITDEIDQMFYGLNV